MNREHQQDEVYVWRKGVQGKRGRCALNQTLGMALCLGVQWKHACNAVKRES